MNYLSLFSGIEAASVAWEPLGWEPIAFAEVEPNCCKLLKERYPEVPNFGDVSKIDWSGFNGKVDVLIGGSPCQSFSIAGNRTGLEGQSGLMFEYIRAVKEVQPRWVLWENVPGVLSQDGGRAFATLQRELENCGYSLAWRVLDAQFFRVAQRRRRVFLVGHIRTECAAEVLFESSGVFGNPESSRQARERLAGDAKSSPNRAFTLKLRHTGSPNVGGGSGALIQDDVSATLATNQDQTLFAPIAIAGNIIDRKPENGGHHLGIETDGACYAQTTADRHGVAYCLQGNMIGRNENNGPAGNGINKDVAFTQNCTDQHAVCFDTTQVTSKTNRSNPKTGDPCHPLCAAGDAPLLVDDKTTICLGDDNANASIDNNLCGALKIGGSQPILCRASGSANAETLENCSPCQTARQYKDGAFVVGENEIAEPRFVVRRLTPVECERLQGFPDGWTVSKPISNPSEQEIDYYENVWKTWYATTPKKDGTISKKSRKAITTWLAKETVDGTRYKALGNSMAVPVIHWLGKRIELTDAKYRLDKVGE